MAPSSKRSGKVASTADTRKLFLEKLSTSCLDEKDAKALCMKVANPSELKENGHPVKQAFELPYFDLKGKPTTFKRWRYLEDTREGFEKQTKKKPLRYVQPKDSLPEIYLPPLVDWSKIQKDPTVEIAITEGELKAACCTKLMLPCIGLGGVYSFKSKKKEIPIHPLLKSFNWAGRKVYVIYDSDAHTNPMVVAARNEICRELLSLGALPHITELMEGPKGEKLGLDDTLFMYGEDHLKTLLGTSKAFAMAEELFALSEEVAYIKDPGIVVNMETSQRMRASDFTTHAYANRHYYEMSHDAEGNEKFTKKKAAKAWLEWEHRFELAGMAYEPGDGRITEENKFNTWQGWGCVPKKGDIKPWKDLLDHLFGESKEERSWFERWCALPLQQPGVKMYTASVLWGVRTGTGKSLTGYSLGRIYGKNFTEIGDTELQDTRCEWAVDKQFVLGDDVTGQEQRKHADRLKKMITQQNMRIDQKYVPSYEVRDCINYQFTSNHPDAFFLEDDDRRFFVHEVVCAPLPVEFYRNYMKWLEGDGAAHLLYHLLNLDLNGMTAEDRAPVTQARQAMIEDGLSDVGVFVRKLRDDPESALKIGAVSMEGDLWSAQDLLMFYDPDSRRRVTSGGLSRELKRAGFRQAYNGGPIKTKTNGQVRLFAIRNAEKWLKASFSELAKHYDDSRTMKEKVKKF